MLKPSTNDRRHRRPGEPVTPLPGQRRHRPADVDGLLEHVQRRHVEAEIVDGAGDLAVLDEEHPVSGQPGEQHRHRVDLAQVPLRCDQQPTLQVRRPDRRRCVPAAPPVSTRLSLIGTKGSPNSAAEPLVCNRFEITPPVSRSQRPIGAPLSKTETSSAECAVTTNGMDSRPAARRIAEQGESAIGQSLADPGPAARGGERRTTLVRRPGAGAPGQEQQKIGHRRRRQHRVVPAGRQVDVPAGPVQPLAPGSRPQPRRRLRGSRLSTPRPTRTVAGQPISRSPRAGRLAAPSAAAGPSTTRDASSSTRAGRNRRGSDRPNGHCRTRPPAIRAGRRRRRRTSTPGHVRNRPDSTGSGTISGCASCARPDCGGGLRGRLGGLHHLGNGPGRIRSVRRCGDRPGRAVDEGHHEPGQATWTSRWWSRCCWPSARSPRCSTAPRQRNRRPSMRPAPRR